MQKLSSSKECKGCTECNKRKQCGEPQKMQKSAKHAITPNKAKIIKTAKKVKKSKKCTEFWRMQRSTETAINAKNAKK